MRTALLLLAIAATAHAQWDLQTSNTKASLRGIHALGNSVAWASGTEGTVLHTTDNGAHWQRCTTPPGAEKLDFRGIQAFDATTAIVMSSGKGDLSRLYKTTDACQTWKLVFTNPDKDGFWDAIQIDIRKPARSTDDWKDRRYGVLVGDPVNRILSIWETHDAGSTWTRWNKDDPKHHPKTRDNETLFAASNQAAVIPGNNGAFAFVTGGRKSELCMDTLHNPFDAGLWSTIGCRSLGFPGGESAGAFAVAARSAGPLYRSEYHDLMVVGGDYSRPEASGDVIFYPGIPRLILGYRGE